MTKSEYQELVEFIAPRFDGINERFDTIDDRLAGVDKRFDAIDNRFDGIDERFDAIDNRFDAIDNRLDVFDERLRRVEILGEESRNQIQILAEAVSETVSNDKFEAFRSEVAAAFQDLRELLRASHLELDRRVTRLEKGLSS